MRTINAIVLICLILFWIKPYKVYAFGGDIGYADGGGGGGGGGFGGADFGGGDTGGGADFGGGGHYNSDDGVFSDYDRDFGSPNSRIAFILVLITGLLAYIVSSIIAPPVAKHKNPKKLPQNQVDNRSIQRLCARDPSFNKGQVEAQVMEWVESFEDAWCSLDMTPHKEQIRNKLYRSYQKQLASMKKNNRKPKTQELSISECAVQSWNAFCGYEFINVWIEEKKITYIVSSLDYSVLVGNNRTIYHLFYRWKLYRKKGEKTWRLHSVKKLAQVNI